MRIVQYQFRFPWTALDFTVFTVLHHMGSQRNGGGGLVIAL
jgi:hypothetical protein